MSHQLPCIRPERHEPVTCFWSVCFNKSSKVLPSIGPEVQAPENACPELSRAVQVPRQPAGDFRADHVPSSTIWLLSLRRVHEPLAASCPLGRSSAHQRPWNVRDPALAAQAPRQLWSSGCSENCWATAQQTSSVKQSRRLIASALIRETSITRAESKHRLAAQAQY